MTAPVYANFRADEATVSGEKTITFDFKVRKFIIVNDSQAVDLKFKFKDAEEYGTLKPSETFCETITSKTVMLSGADASYRVWGLG